MGKTVLGTREGERGGVTMGTTGTGRISNTEFASRGHQDTEMTAGAYQFRGQSVEAIKMKGGGESGIGIAS